MAQFESSQYQPGARHPEGQTLIGQGRATGIVLFAAVLMIVAGAFHFLQGLTAVINGDFFAVVANYAYDLDIQAWGWLHLLGGLSLFLVGIGLLSGSIWARLLAMFLVVISAMINFVYIPYQPLWAIVLLVIDGVILWALLTQGDFDEPSSLEDVLGPGSQ